MMAAVPRVLLASLIAAGIVSAAASAPAAPPVQAPVRQEVRHELEYLKAVNAAAPPRGAQLLLLLVAQFANAQRHAEGIAFLSERMKDFDDRLTDPQRALYLAAIGSLRAGRARALPPEQRAIWAKETARLFAEAKRLLSRSRDPGGEVFVVRWWSGTALAADEDAEADLTWCVEHAGTAPNPGFMRPVYLRLSAIARGRGQAGKAAELLRLSGSADADPPITLTTPSTIDPRTGLAVLPRRIVDVIPGRAYSALGFDFADLHFVLSDDKRQLIAIDTGTRPENAKDAYDALVAHAPDLPPVGTVFITHSHPDHIGGHRFFRDMASHPKFYARQNYADEVARMVEGTPPTGLRSLGIANVLRAFAPDVLVDRRTEVTVGGTRIELVPIRGGETDDAMLIHL